MLEILKVLPNTFIPLFVAIDIFAVLPIFVSVTATMAKEKRKMVVQQSIVTALAVSLAFIAVGEVVFGILGITVNDFKIAGGLILLILAILELIRHSEEKRRSTEMMGIVPIGVPLIVGPAVLTTLIVLIGHYGVVPSVISLVLNLVIVWLSFIKSEAIINLFGRGGIIAISKIMALLLASIAVMMIRLGIEGIVRL